MSVKAWIWIGVVFSILAMADCCGGRSVTRTGKITGRTFTPAWCQWVSNGKRGGHMVYHPEQYHLIVETPTGMCHVTVYRSDWEHRLDGESCEMAEQVGLWTGWCWIRTLKGNR